MGSAMIQSGDAPGGEAVARESLAMRRKVLGGDSPMVARTLTIVASARAEQKDDAGADELYRECMRILDARKIGPSHPTRVSFSIDHAAVLRRLGQREQAGVMLRTAVAALRDPANPRPNDLARALDRYADLLTDAGETPGADAALTEALSIRTTTLGPDHEITTQTRDKLERLRRPTNARDPDAAAPPSAPTTPPR
jgi:Tetratricopeptide repeat